MTTWSLSKIYFGKKLEVDKLIIDSKQSDKRILKANPKITKEKTKKVWVKKDPMTQTHRVIIYNIKIENT